mgnify:CR=1 FL=1
MKHIAFASPCVQLPLFIYRLHANPITFLVTSVIIPPTICYKVLMLYFYGTILPTKKTNGEVLFVLYHLN